MVLLKFYFAKDFLLLVQTQRNLHSPDNLAAKGATIYYGQTYEHISDEIDVVVYTAAVHPDNPEYQAASEKQIPLMTRAELLGQIMANYHISVGIAGTHGKTTTTSMVTQILLETELDPTISVGGIMPAIGGNIRVGSSNVFVTEACEYTNSFLSFSSKYGNYIKYRSRSFGLLQRY